MRRMICSR
jgi:hypothetical protein